MKLPKTLMLLSLVFMCSGVCLGVEKPHPFCGEKIASDFLTAILARDREGIKAIANNPKVLDKSTMPYLIGDDKFRFPNRSDLRSAYTVLTGHKILTKVIVLENSDGSHSIDAIYLPVETAPDFVKLAAITKARIATPFRDFIVCGFVEKQGNVSMNHICYSETDEMD